MSQKLDEVTIRKEFDVAEALSAIQFYWNLAKHKGHSVVVEIWNTKVSDDKAQAPKGHSLQETRKEETPQEVSVGHHSE